MSEDKVVTLVVERLGALVDQMHEWARHMGSDERQLHREAADVISELRKQVQRGSE